MHATNGNGAGDADYTGKDVRGKIVLADGVLARVQELAIAEHGAAGIVSDMPNQTTAWSGARVCETAKRSS